MNGIAATGLEVETAETSSRASLMLLSSFGPKGPGSRNAFVLALSQGLYVCGISVDLTLTGITGYQLAPDKALATLPFALITVGSAIVTVFAAYILGRIGRRLGFAVGSLCGTAGGLISVFAVFHSSFWIFCLGTALIGAY